MSDSYFEEFKRRMHAAGEIAEPLQQELFKKIYEDNKNKPQCASLAWDNGHVAKRKRCYITKPKLTDVQIQSDANDLALGTALITARNNEANMDLIKHIGTQREI